MTNEDFDFLTQEKYIYDFYKNTGEIRHASHRVLSRMLEIARGYSPYFMACLHCPGDISKVLEFVYARYDERQIKAMEAEIITTEIKKQNQIAVIIPVESKEATYPLSVDCIKALNENDAVKLAIDKNYKHIFIAIPDVIPGATTIQNLKKNAIDKNTFVAAVVKDTNKQGIYGGSLSMWKYVMSLDYEGELHRKLDRLKIHTILLKKPDDVVLTAN